MPNVIRMLFFLAIFSIILIKTKCHSVIDLNDILSSNYMPTTFLMLDRTTNDDINGGNNTSRNGEKQKIISDGSMQKALDTMKFHRSMMNQYMCRSYVADQIMSEINDKKFKRRMGQAPPATQQDNKPKFAEKINYSLLFDEGSSAYQNWLSKSATLEDIYQNHNNIESRDDNVYIYNGADEEATNNEDKESYDMNVNDYATKQNAAKAVKIGHRGHNGGLYYVGGENYYPYHQGYSEHIGLGGSGHSVANLYENAHQPVVVNHPTKHHVHYTGYDKADELADIFEIALTALAYLSFGMFIVHLIMSISAVKNNATATPAAMMMPMSMSPTASATGGGNVPGTGGGTTSTGAGGGSTSTGGGPTSTGGGASTGGGTTSTGAGVTSTGGGAIGTGGGTTSTGGGVTGTGGGATSTGGGTGVGDTGTGGDTTGTTGGGTGDGTGSATATGTGDGADTFKFRLKRDIPTLTSPDNIALNEMAKRILSTIDAALVAYSDNSECLQKSLCVANKYSRSLNGLNKLIFPIWSLGMSWVSGLVTKNGSSKSRIDGLKAALLGLGMANCDTTYQKCDLRRAKLLGKRKEKK